MTANANPLQRMRHGKFRDGRGVSYSSLHETKRHRLEIWVPDLAGFAAAHDLVGKSDVEIREAIGDKFPKRIYHSIFCTGTTTKAASL
jgi:hypothetical protein